MFEVVESRSKAVPLRDSKTAPRTGHNARFLSFPNPSSSIE